MIGTITQFSSQLPSKEPISGSS